MTTSSEQPTGPLLLVGLGYTGRRIRDRNKYNTLTISRSSATDLDDPTSIERCHDNLQQQLDDREIPDVIYTVPPSRHDHRQDRRITRFIDMLPGAPRRFIYFSTTGVYGDRNGEVVDETATPAPSTERAWRRLAAEQAVLAACARWQAEPVILRVPGIYGPDRLGLNRIEDRQPVIAESEANPGNRIHVDDLATCALHALDATVPPGIYNVGDGDERSSSWFIKEVARQAGLPPPPEVSRQQAMETFSSTRLSFLQESRRLALGKMRQCLKVTPRYADAAVGIAASLDAMKNAHDQVAGV